MSASTPQSLAVVSRYSDAYFNARAIVGFGTAIKIIGIVVAALFVVGSLLADARYLLIAVPFALVIGAMFFLMGIFVSAQGQILKATLDGAVNSSPFLTNNQRAKIMSLPAEQDASVTETSNKCPNCGDSAIEVYQRSREGQGWICQACKHVWRVPA
jgi:predicted RNA-binding Zn-ribbon protein involved in translation (DUF1610 family)